MKKMKITKDVLLVLATFTILILCIALSFKVQKVKYYEDILNPLCEMSNEEREIILTLLETMIIYDEKYIESYKIVPEELDCEYLIE